MKKLLLLLILFTTFIANSQKIYVVDSQFKADIKVYVVDSQFAADLKIYFVSSQFKAGWKKSSKKHLLY